MPSEGLVLGVDNSVRLRASVLEQLGVFHSFCMILCVTANLFTAYKRIGGLRPPLVSQVDAAVQLSLAVPLIFPIVRVSQGPRTIERRRGCTGL